MTEIKVYLDGFNDRFVFALNCSALEQLNDPQLLYRRVKKAMDVLISDWEKAGKP